MSQFSAALENSSSFQITTPMVRELHDRITHWTWCGLNGGVIIGEARSGKTFAIRALADHITSRAGQKIPVVRCSYGELDRKTIREAFSKTAKALGCQFKERATSDTLSEMIIKKLAEMAIINESRKVILIIDEAQFLRVEQLNAFAQIYNELFEAGVNCVIFFVANEDRFAPLAKELMKQENSYLRERFFVNVHNFYGIRNAAELKKCLGEFDKYIVDIQNGMSATQKFCPHLYEQGWRISSLSGQYWTHYCEQYKKPLKQKSLRMNQFIRATNILLMDYLPECKDSDDTVYMEAAIIKSLEAACITPDLVKYAK